MSDQLPEFTPLMLSGLTYSEAVKQMRVTGCSVRRPHWCAPVLIIDQDHVMLDDEGDLTPWTPAREDERARDWSMVAALKDA